MFYQPCQLGRPPHCCLVTVPELQNFKALTLGMLMANVFDLKLKFEGPDSPMTE